MSLFWKNLQFIFRPTFWDLRHPFCPKWDKELNELMDTNRFEIIKFNGSSITGVYKLGEYHIWAECYPYAYARRTNFFKNHNSYNFTEEHSPSRLTILRVRKRIEQDLKKRLVFRP
jgi:hypothetical protein